MVAELRRLQPSSPVLRKSEHRRVPNRRRRTAKIGDVANAADHGTEAVSSRAAIADRLGGFIYGTLVVLAVIVTGSKAYPDDAAYIAAVLAVTTAVLWLAHVYAHAIAHSVSHDEHLSLAEIRRIAGREAALLEAGVPSIAALLLLGATGVLSTRSAVWVAVGLGMAVLAVQGVRFARVERLSRLGTLAVVAANLGLGLLLIGLKVLVSH